MLENDSPLTGQAAVTDDIARAVEVVLSGGVIAYPTESCFGLGCDPQNVAAVKRILAIKRRHRRKGLILVADRFARFDRYLEPLSEPAIEAMQNSWPGPNTWLCPAKSNVSEWLRGDHDSLAIRVTAHQTAAKICRDASMAIISTSANVATRPSLRSTKAVMRELGSMVDLVVDRSIGSDSVPSTIRDVITRETLR